MASGLESEGHGFNLGHLMSTLPWLRAHNHLTEN